MRVLLVSDNHLAGRDGVGASVSALMDGLGQLGHDVAVLSPGTLWGARKVDGRVYHAPAVPLGYVECRVSWAPSRAFGWAMRSFRPDVVHVQTLGPLGLAAARGCGADLVPRVFTWHTDLVGYLAAYPALRVAIPFCVSAFTGDRRWLRGMADGARAAVYAVRGNNTGVEPRRLVAEAVGGFTHVITPSTKAARGFPRTRAGQRVHVIPSSAVPGRRLDAGGEAILRSALDQIADPKLAIAFVGRLSPEKNLDGLLNAMAGRILPSHPSARLTSRS